MSIKSELTVLKTNIQNAKNKLYSNLTDKGVTTITTASTLDAMADSVSNITVGEGGSSGDNPFSVIGYTSTPQYIVDSFVYSQEIIDGWNINNTRLSVNDNTIKLNMIYFPLIDTSNVTDMFQSFRMCDKLQYIPPLNTSNVTNMGGIFSFCYSLTSLDLSGWNTSKVTSMSNMFESCSGLTSLDLTVLDVSNVGSMGYMFTNCTKLKSLDLSGWNTSNLTNMGYMFNNCSGLTSLDLSSFDTSNVIYMWDVFSGCKALKSLDLSGWNTSNVTDMSRMFSNCNALTSITFGDNFTCESVSKMEYMFSNCAKLTSLDLSSFDTSNLTSVKSMFSNCEALTSLDLSSFDTSNVTDMDKMLYYCVKLKKVDGYISFKSYSSSTMSYTYLVGSKELSELRKITFKDVGYNSNTTQFNNKYVKNWGVNDDTITDARQSLIDSLITYSFDRATAGYSTCTVTLSTNTKPVLTEDEIAQITAKGFTIA